MTMMDWAKREVEIVCKPTKGEAETESVDYKYNCACVESAFKAYASLMEDGHSGLSINITKHILNRLIDGKPLTPIEDDPDIWNEVMENHERTIYQCARMGSLFKYVYADGTVKYSDNNRCYGIDINDPDSAFQSGAVMAVVDEIFPITMPYSPGERIKVYCEDFSSDEQNDRLDTRVMLYLITPDNEKIEVNRFFEASGLGWREIDKDEYEKRKAGRTK